MHEAFREGFEKKAFLQDLWKGKEHLLERATELKMLNRAKNMGVKIKEYSSPVRDIQAGTSDMLTKLLKPSLYKSSPVKPGDGMRLSPALAWPGYSGGEVYVPSHGVVSRAWDKLRGQGHRHAPGSLWNPKKGLDTAIKEHELDEVAATNRRLQATGANPKHDPQMQQFHLAKHLNEPVGHAQERMYRSPRASHMSPTVLLDESNRAFHEATPEVRSQMQSLRERTGEIAHLQSRGLRYGEEYVQPGTRRYNKLVRTLSQPHERSLGSRLEGAPKIEGIFKERP